MFELIGSMVLALVMVPVVMAMILGLIYGLGELFNVISKNETQGQGIER
ncbi:Multidrug efflux pump accessory protein AcrZ [Xenorhabdus beddingii]|uniref:Multidrug efflux pump accessory protein AcrZ n=1 Tax=Xenorhabdus beddingii TaxID=40578 RepID=A0A1Y2SQY9_9GAMM|nr:AcrZ family multidrug efflux pump-associated protein [Xenorhabdus beddingii]OTA21532.1 Multidrug efflux pump accessory protein AcrZ [Xenorhabdus beddingii]